MGRFLKEEVATPWLMYLSLGLITVGAWGPDFGLPVGRYRMALFVAAIATFYLSRVDWSHRDRDRSGEHIGTPGDRSGEPGPPMSP